MRFSGTFGLFALTMMSQSQANPLRPTQKTSHLPNGSNRYFWWLAFMEVPIMEHPQVSPPSDDIKRSAINYCDNDQDCIHAFIMVHWYGHKN